MVIMRRLNSNISDTSIEEWKTPYSDIIAVGTIQFFLSLLILCYGVYLMQFFLEDFCNMKTGLWTAISFVAASKITNPWTKSYCKHLNNIRHKVYKRNIIATVILLFGELVLASFIKTPIIQIVFYGIFGGVLSSIIYVHLKFATAEAFNSRPQLFEMVDQIMKPFCLIFMPHLVLLLTNLYGTAHSQLIIAGLILNIIPACLVVKTTSHQKMRLCKFQTVDRLSIEMADLNPKPPTIIEPSSSSSSSDDDDDEEEEEENDELKVKKTEKLSPEVSQSSKTVQVYYQNVGVNILPDIPEENEADEEDDINEISSKRLSKISAMLQELNENTHKDVNLSINNLYQPDEIIESVEQDFDIPEFIDEPSPKRSRCFSISSNTIYNLKAKRRRFKSFMNEHFVKSFPRTLGSLYFYPAIVSSCITTTLSTIIFAVAPCLMFFKYNLNKYPMTTEDSTFVLTIIGFTWLFFLAGYPVLSKLSSLKIKILFLIGLSISGLSLFIAQKFSYDNFTLFSLTFGLGYGIVSYTENMAYEDFFGTANWKKLQGALEICTGYLVILVYLIIYFSSLEIRVLLLYIYWLYVFNVSLWIVAYILKRIVLYIRNIRRYNRERYPDYNF